MSATKTIILDENDRTDIDSSIENLSNVSGDTILSKIDTVPLSKGGTGATTSEDARTALGAAASVHDHSAADITSGILEIARGGTGALDAATALQNLGVPAAVTEALETNGVAKIQAGSYVGTGTYGADNPCSLTFDLMPQPIQMEVAC